jgi:hypothetical protein
MDNPEKQRKQKEQSRMDNPETQATLCTRHRMNTNKKHRGATWTHQNKTGKLRCSQRLGNSCFLKTPAMLLIVKSAKSQDLVNRGKTKSISF